jgi:hypothetical protein
MVGRTCALTMAMLVVAFEVKAQDPPRVIPAEPGADAPPGYHHEDRPRLGPLIGGAVTTAFGGAFVIMGIQEHYRAHGIDDMDYSTLFYVLGGAHLAAGVPLLVWGALSKKHVLVRNDARLMFVPLAGSQGALASVRIPF